MEIKAIRGFNDILPQEIGKWHFVEDTARDVFESFGFSELRIPVMGRTDLFARGIGEATDIVEKEMYTFTDKGGNSLPLRPEVIVMLMHFLHKVGLQTLELQINSLGCRECRPRYREELKRFFEKKSFQLCEDCQRRLQTNPLRILDCKVESCQESIANAPRVIDFICSHCKEHFASVKEYLTVTGVK